MDIVVKSLVQVWETFREIWLYLLLSVLISAAMRRYVSGERINQWLQKYRSTSIIAATSLAVSTPLCSCGGGIAVALSMMAAFLLVGAGTSLGAVAGLLTIARWRVVAVVTVTLLWVSSLDMLMTHSLQ